MMPSQGDAVRQWAAGVILDAGSVSRNTYPPGFGSTDWNAKDGVLKYTLKLAAEYVLREQKWEEPIIDRAFAALWPEIWLVCHSHGVPTAEQWAAALATMELIDPPSIYWLQVHGVCCDSRWVGKGLPPGGMQSPTEYPFGSVYSSSSKEELEYKLKELNIVYEDVEFQGDIRPLAEFLGLPIPEPEGNNGTFPGPYEDGDNITRGDADDCVVTIQRAAPIPPDIMVRIKGIDFGSGSAWADVSPVVAPHTHVDTMAAGFEHQPQYRGPANGLAAALSTANRY